MDTTPIPTAGTVTVGPPEQANGLSARAQNTRSCGAMTITPTRQHPVHIGGSGATVARQLATLRDLVHRHRTTTTAAQLEGLPPVRWTGEP